MIRLLKTPNNKRKFLVFLGDVIIMAAVISFLVFLHAFLVRHGVLRDISRPLKPYTLYISLIVYILISYIFEMYDIKRREKLRTLTSMLRVSFLSFCVMFGLAKVLRINQTTMFYIFVFFVIISFVLYSWRSVYRRVLLSSINLLKQKVLFIEIDSNTKEILNETRRRDYKLVGILTEKNVARKNNINLEIIGSCDDLERTVRTEKIDIIITAIDQNLPLYIVKNLYKFLHEGVKVYDSASFYEILTRKTAIKQYLDSDCIPYLTVDMYLRQSFLKIKNLLDMLLAVLALIVLSPLFLMTMILVKVSSKGPIFFVQQRIGFQEKSFNIVKFRTMVPGAEKETGPAWASKNDVRVTKVGRFLRRTRLDEIPQLISIIRGDMSFVGPRPFRKHFVDVFEEKVPFYSLKFSIKPGLTGWAQVNHNYSDDKQTLEDNIERLQYDLYYLKHASVFLDIFIILKTIQTIVQRPAY